MQSQPWKMLLTVVVALGNQANSRPVTCPVLHAVLPHQRPSERELRLFVDRYAIVHASGRSFLPSMVMGESKVVGEGIYVSKSLLLREVFESIR